MFKKIIYFLSIIPLFIISHSVYAANEPIFSVQGGFYTNSFELVLSAAEGISIYYTADGSDPTVNSIEYTAPIKIEEPIFSPLTSYLNTLEQYKVNGIIDPFYSGTVIKAIAVLPDGTASKVITNSYFVKNDIKTMFDIPVMSVSISPKNCRGSTGLYQMYLDDIESQCFIEYFNPDGSLGFIHSSSVKIAGHTSREARKKSLRFNFTKGKYENDKLPLKYDIIQGTKQNYYSNNSVTEHGKLNIRISDWTYSTIREPVAQAVAAPLRADTANSRPTAVFINGEFWGIYDLREQYDNNYIQYHYGIPKNKVVQFEFDFDTKNEDYEPGHYFYRYSYEEGPESDEEYYKTTFRQMYNLITGGSISNKETYENLKNYMDIDNFIDYAIVYFFLANDDWPGNNIKMWRSTKDHINTSYGADGKWRFMIHDFDIAMHDINHDSVTVSSNPGSGGDTDPRHPTWATNIIKYLMQNEEFRNRISSRYLTYLGTAFSTERLNSIVDMQQKREMHTIAYDFKRWNILGESDDLSIWNSYINGLHSFFNGRGSHVMGELREYFNNNFNTEIEENYATINFKTDSDKGWFDISGAQIRPDLYETASNFKSSYFRGMPIEIKAISKSGYKFLRFEVRQGNNPAGKIMSDVYTFTPDKTQSCEYNIKAVFVPEKKAYVKDINVIEGNDYIDGQIDIENPTPEANSDIILALYNDKNKLIGFKKENRPIPFGNSHHNIQAKINDKQNVRKVKMFIWNDCNTLNPACEAYDATDNYNDMTVAKWTSDDVGEPSLNGSMGFNNGVYSITGSGEDIWTQNGTFDQFHFVYQKVSGDCTIIAHVQDIQNTAEFAKAGIMMRESLESNSKNVFVTATSSEGLLMSYRRNQNTYSYCHFETPNTGWLKLKRIGNIFSGYYSIDGENWISFSNAELQRLEIAIPSIFYVGMAVTSHDVTKLCNATFDHVAVYQN